MNTLAASDGIITVKYNADDKVKQVWIACDTCN